MILLGIDIGTGGSRACLIDDTGVVLASATSDHQPISSLKTGWAEQSPDDWWQACCGSIRRAIAESGIDAREITGVGFSGQMHGSVLLDEMDDVLRPALLWCDQRTATQCVEITEKFGGERLVELVSNPAITGFTLPKLLWVRENEPNIWERVRCVLLPKDYIRFRLTNDKASDVADSSGTLLFDVKQRTWSNEMLTAFDLHRELLPTVFESTEVTGTISKAGADATGLTEGTKVVAGAGDNAAGAIGTGIVSPGSVGVTIGTSGVVFIVTDKPKLDLKGRVHSMCHAIPKRWHMTGVTLAAGASLKWFRENFGCGKSYDELTAEASRVPPGSHGAMWLPYLMGERTPHLDANARAAFVGLTAGHSRAHLARAVMEGVAFSLREAIDIFRELDVPIENIRLGGGGARSSLWRQIQADVYGQTVETIVVDEGAAFGAALLAGVGVGAWNSVDEACKATIKVADRIGPDPKAVEDLNVNYEAYKMLYPALQPAIQRIIRN